MELVDMLGLGSSSFIRVRVQVPFLVKHLKPSFKIILSNKDNTYIKYLYKNNY